LFHLSRRPEPNEHHLEEYRKADPCDIGVRLRDRRIGTARFEQGGAPV